MALSNAMPSRFRAVVQLASWCQLRKGELCALRRRDIDLLRGRITVAQNLQQLRDGRIIIKEPKSDAGFRTIAVPPHVIPLLEEHLRLFTAEVPDALVFTGERGWAGAPTCPPEALGENAACRSAGLSYTCTMSGTRATHGRPPLALRRAG